MTKIKLCGIKRIEDVEMLNRLLPEYAGFIFAQKSKRYVTAEQALSLRKAMDPRIMCVGVFKDSAIPEIEEIVSLGAIDIIQLHGSEDDIFIRELAGRLPHIIIKAFGIRGERDVALAESSAADFVLLDSPGGGTGESFDHGLLAGIKRPYFLAGGLDPSNVGGYIESYRPYAVDVSSGIETDGVKDPAKMEAFVLAARA